MCNILHVLQSFSCIACQHKNNILEKQLDLKIDNYVLEALLGNKFDNLLIQENVNYHNTLLMDVISRK